MYVWKNRGRAPAGYVKGVFLNYATSYCKAATQMNSLVAVMNGPFGAIENDALAYYDLSDFEAVVPIRLLYTLGIGLGMRESSGNTTEGHDRNVKNPSSETAEAGLFQSSYDSLNSSSLLGALFDLYRNDRSNCEFDTFMEGLVDKKRTVVGSGKGAEFQTLTKACPIFSVEYAMVMLRVNRRHYGPINRKEAEVRGECYEALKEVESIVGQAGCDEVLSEECGY